MKNALNNQVGMLGDMFLWLVANLKQGVIYFIKQALPPNISAGSVAVLALVHLVHFEKELNFLCTTTIYQVCNRLCDIREIFTQGLKNEED